MENININQSVAILCDGNNIERSIHEESKSSNTMINFDTPDISGLSNKLIDNDIECLRRPEREQWGGIVATFRDPDGNIIQFLQQPENRRV